MALVPAGKAGQERCHRQIASAFRRRRQCSYIQGSPLHGLSASPRRSCGRGMHRPLSSVSLGPHQPPDGGRTAQSTIRHNAPACRHTSLRSRSSPGPLPLLPCGRPARRVPSRASRRELARGQGQEQKNSRAAEASERSAAAPRAEPCAQAVEAMLQAKIMTEKCTAALQTWPWRGAGAAAQPTHAAKAHRGPGRHAKPARTARLRGPGGLLSRLGGGQP